MRLWTTAKQNELETEWVRKRGVDACGTLVCESWIVGEIVIDAGRYKEMCQNGEDKGDGCLNFFCWVIHMHGGNVVRDK